MSEPITRGALEVDDGTFIEVDALASSPFKAELLRQAEHAVHRDLKEALWGLGPIFGRERLLTYCAAIIEEDFQPDRPQTPRSDFERDEEARA